MPELPEVEVVRRGLADHVLGRLISNVEVRHPRAVRRHVGGATDLIDGLVGGVFTAASRRGKYLWLPIAGATDAGATDAGATARRALVAHLGMSGQMVLRRATSGDPHLRVTVEFADRGPALCFVDQRTFGGLALNRLVPTRPVDGAPEGLVPESVAHLARDPLDPAFDDAAFVVRLRRRRTALKRAMLDQTLVSGIGNIYADEALWRASLHWSRPTQTLPRSGARRLLDAVRAVMTEALAAGGTSFDRLYVDVTGRSGWFAPSLVVYGQAGRPCPRCGSRIRREPFMNRSSYSCPTCQPVPGHPRR